MNRLVVGNVSLGPWDRPPAYPDFIPSTPSFPRYQVTPGVQSLVDIIYNKPEQIPFMRIDIDKADNGFIVKLNGATKIASSVEDISRLIAETLNSLGPVKHPQQSKPKSRTEPSS